MNQRANTMMKRSSDGFGNLGETSLDFSDPEIAEAIDDVFNPAGENMFALIGYKGKSNTLKVIDQSPDYEDCEEGFEGGKAAFALCRFVHKSGSNEFIKYVYIAWLGEGVPPLKKGVFITHADDFAKFCLRDSKYHLRIDARMEEDVTEAAVRAKLKQGAGANFDAQSAGTEQVRKFVQEVVESAPQDYNRDTDQSIGNNEPEPEPAYEEPAYEEPAYEEPAYEEPAYEEPAYEAQQPEAAYEEPAYEEPAYEEPAYEAQQPEAAYEEPAYEEQQQYAEGEYQEGYAEGGEYQEGYAEGEYQEGYAEGEYQEGYAEGGEYQEGYAEGGEYQEGC